MRVNQNNNCNSSAVAAPTGKMRIITRKKKEINYECMCGCVGPAAAAAAAAMSSAILQRK